MKRAPWVLPLLGLLLGCGGESARTAVPVAVLLPDSATSARWEADDRRYLAAAFRKAGVACTIVNAEGDARVQQAQAEQAVTNGAKVLLLAPIDAGSAAAIIATARASGVKVIDYDRLTTQGEGADFYVSFDGEEVGRVQARGLIRAVEQAGIERPRLVILNGGPTDNNAVLFSDGAHDVLDEKTISGEWHLQIEEWVPQWDNQKALVLFEQILTAYHGEVDCVLAANDGIAAAVVSALANQGYPPLPLTGQDATVGGVQLVLAGKQSMTVYKAIRKEAEAAAALAVALVRGEDTAKLTNGTVHNGTREIPAFLIEPVAVTKDNVAETVIADGFRTWDEICVGEFAAFCPQDR
jgi:D-xylose transport system substrate-binding protein